MLNERQYYGLVSALPALQLGKCPPLPWEALWQSSAAFVDADTQQLLAALYLPLEHLPCLLGKWPDHHPYPSQFTLTQLATADPFPYADREALLVLRQQPLATALSSLMRSWQSWIRQYPLPLLHQYLDISNELTLYQLQWRASDQASLADLLQKAAIPALSALETALEQALMPGELQQLVHSNNSYDETLLADQLRWRWLEDQVFHDPFGLNALVSYALRQQISWQWYVAPDFNASNHLRSTLQKMLV